MSKVAWEGSCSSFFHILNPVFGLMRCFGLDFHSASVRCWLITRLVQGFWVTATLSICAYQLFVDFPATFKSSKWDTGTSSLNFSLEFINYWLYNLFVFIGSWWIATRAAELWTAIEQLLIHVPLNAHDIKRCRKTTIQCVVGTLLMVLLNLAIGVVSAIILNYSTTDTIKEITKVIYIYSFGSSALFISAGRIISISFETISRQLQLNCCPASSASSVWKYQRQFGIACQAAELLARVFGFVLFATVTYTFVGFVNTSYNLLRIYQRLPSSLNDVAYMNRLAPDTVRMLFSLGEHLIRLWMICHTADLIRAKALSLVPILQTIRNDLYSRPSPGDESSEEVHAFLLEVSETSPSFEVLGLFTLTKQVIISLIGTTLTYLVVLCQFSAAEVSSGKAEAIPTVKTTKGTTIKTTRTTTRSAPTSDTNAMNATSSYGLSSKQAITTTPTSLN